VDIIETTEGEVNMEVGEVNAPSPKIVAPSAATEPQLLRRNALGVWEIAFFVIAAAAPLMVIAGAAFTTFRLGGIGAPNAYVIAGIVLLFFAIGFTAMSKYIKNAGAFYAYILRGLGKPIGVGAALVAVFAYSILNIGFYGLFAYFANTTVQQLFGVNVSWKIWIIVGVLIVGFFGYRNVELGAKFLSVFLTAEVLILLALSIAVLVRGGPEGFSLAPFSPKNFFVPGIGALLVFGFGAFTGFESTAIYAEEARNPEHTIPRATYIAVAFLAIFYGFTAWIATAAFGVKGVMALAMSDKYSDMYFTAANHYLGYWSEFTMRILIITSVLACQIGFHNACSRYFFSLGREGLLPKILGRAHRTMHSPYIASALQTVLSILVALIFIIINGDPYLQLFVWTYGPGVVGLVLCQFLCVCAVVGFFLHERRGHNVFRVVIAPIIGALGLGVSLYLIFANFDLLSGYTGAVNLAFILPVPVIFIGGVIMAYRVKATNPAKYAQLAADMEDVNVCALDEVARCETGA
jgi:amino acid transporter